MKLAFALELTSQEAYLGIGLGGIAFIVACLLRRGGDANTNHIANQNSPGAQTKINQSKRTQVNINAKVSINQAAPSPPPPPPPPPRQREPRADQGSGSRDDAMGFFAIAVFSLLGVGFFYLQNFEVITFWSRAICFAASTYALLYGGLDVWSRGVRGDQIQWSYLLAGLVSGAAAGFLLQAQALISTDWVRAAQAQQHGLVDFFLHRLPSGGLMFVTASLLATAAVCLASAVSLFVILRALVLSQQDDAPASWPARKFLDITEWVQPVPFMIMSTLSLGFVVFILYFWLPQGLQMGRGA